MYKILKQKKGSGKSRSAANSDGKGSTSKGILQLCGDTEEDFLLRRLKTNDFRIGAGLDSYSTLFGERFMTDLLGPVEEGSGVRRGGLRAEDRWLDGGAGKAQAIADYYEKGGLARTTAIGYEMPELAEGLSEYGGRGQFEYLSDKYFQEFSDEEDLRSTSERDKFKIITDFNGVLSYTRTLSEDLQKYLDNLAVEGKLYTSFYAEIEGSDIFTWLERIEGVTIEYHENSYSRAIIITKKRERTTVPPLYPVSCEESSTKKTPDRKYRLL